MTLTSCGPSGVGEWLDIAVARKKELYSHRVQPS